VSLEFLPGEIHALLGENGAGKSTLANVLDGRIRPVSGTVELPGRVGHVHQHFAIPPGLTASECLAIEGGRLRAISRRRLALRMRAIEESSGIALGDPEAEAAELPIGARQRLELARALAGRPELLLLDEPTAVLAPSEIESFTRAIRKSAAAGTAVVFITHKLPEVFAVADRVSLLRRGRLLFTRPARETSAGEIAALFLEGVTPPERPARRPGAPVLVIAGLSGSPAAGRAPRPGITVTVSEREIVAIVGVDGNGQDRIVEAVAGLSRPATGTVTLSGRPVEGGAFRRSGASIVPGDRQREGLILDFSVAENLRLAEPIPSLDDAFARRLVAEHGILAPSIDTAARSLSGGNQQKVVLARELSRAPRFLMAISPTRGLDLAASRATLAALGRAADAGGAVLLVTSDLDEARAVADVLHVLYRGELAGPFPPDTGLDRIGRAMAGLAA
jgi:simple sugar transport system ATP-binding protein